MDMGGVATLSLLGTLACLFLVVGIVGRTVPSRMLVTKVRKLDSWRVS
jgi:hypothetical protein